jgi:hypothetical protein
MTSTNIVAATDGFEDRTFACGKCGHTETRRPAADPLASPPAVAWTKDELKPPE